LHADEAGRDLQVEQVPRRLADPLPAEPYFLAAGVDDDQARWVNEQVPEEVERAGAERVDEEEALRRRHLDQAQVRVVGLLADELGVEPQLRTVAQVLAAGSHPPRRADDLLRDVFRSFPRRLRFLGHGNSLLTSGRLRSRLAGKLSVAEAP